MNQLGLVKQSVSIIITNVMLVVMMTLMSNEFSMVFVKYNKNDRALIRDLHQTKYETLYICYEISGKNWVMQGRRHHRSWEGHVPTTYAGCTTQGVQPNLRCTPAGYYSRPLKLRNSHSALALGNSAFCSCTVCYLSCSLGS